MPGLSVRAAGRRQYHRNKEKDQEIVTIPVMQDTYDRLKEHAQGYETWDEYFMWKDRHIADAIGALKAIHKVRFEAEPDSCWSKNHMKEQIRKLENLI